jgi:hypothetical protein
MSGEFSILGFVQHLGVMGAEMAIAEHEALERAAQIVEKEAKASVGEYQGQAGPFVAWAELAPATKFDRAGKGFPENEPELRTGEMRDSIEHTIIGREAHIGSNSDVLYWQEVGTKNMPPRSILGGAAVRKTDEVLADISSEVITALSGVEIGRNRFSRSIPGPIGIN